jgi:uncharacterized membrane protein
LIAAIAILGVLNTGYLTFTKLFGGEAACPTSGCEQVLSSAYAYVFGLPLALFGLLAYVGMTAFAIAPLTINTERNKDLRTQVDRWTWLLLFIGATAMMAFSAYLMYIMVTEFVIPNGLESICFYCIASALFALTLFILTLIGRVWEDVGQLFFTGIIVGVVVLIGALGVYAEVSNGSSPTVGTNGQAGPAITTTSGASEVALARYLKNNGAKMFGAYWCPHCHDQKQLFGEPAVKEIPYVECAPDGQNSQTALCQETNVTGFPTWEINGQLYPGTQTLDQLADLAGYQGPREFKN